MTCTVTKSEITFSNRNLAGDYSPTALDTDKESNNRLTCICGKFYTVVMATGEQITLTGKRTFDKWANSNLYVTDF